MDKRRAGKACLFAWGFSSACTALLGIGVGCVFDGLRRDSIANTVAPTSQPASTLVFDLTPPPPDQLQPHFVCVNPNVRLEPVWYGQCFTSAWEILNTGAAPLCIRLWP